MHTIPRPRPLARSLLLAGYVEDLPRPRNRIRRGGDGRLVLDRRFDPFDVKRGRALARSLVRLMRQAGATIVLPVVAKRDREHLAHQVGTWRAGRDPARSVVDPDGRVHGLEDLWIVEGSVFPTSLGVGPALTIAALALRSADRMLARRVSR